MTAASTVSPVCSVTDFNALYICVRFPIRSPQKRTVAQEGNPEPQSFYQRFFVIDRMVDWSVRGMNRHQNMNDADKV
jgi:hypothetical protein